MITGRQIRHARVLLNLSQSRLAYRSKLKLATVYRAETTDGEPPITIADARAIQRVLESDGIEFTNGDEPGVKLNAKG